MNNTNLTVLILGCIGLSAWTHEPSEKPPPKPEAPFEADSWGFWDEVPPHDPIPGERYMDYEAGVVITISEEKHPNRHRFQYSSHKSSVDMGLVTWYERWGEGRYAHLVPLTHIPGTHYVLQEERILLLAVEIEPADRHHFVVVKANTYYSDRKLGDIVTYTEDEWLLAAHEKTLTW